MTHVIRVTLLLSVLSAPAAAQTVVASATLPEAYRPLSVSVTLIEADGNPATVEILATDHQGRVSVGRPTCAGPWLHVWDIIQAAGASWLSSVSVTTLQGRVYWLVREHAGPATLLALDPCRPRP